MKNKTYLASVKKLILAAVVGFATLCLGAAETTIDGITWKYTVSPDGATIKGSEWNKPAVPDVTSGAVVVPSELGGAPVVAIGSWAFYGCNKITSVQIPDGVLSIGFEAFFGCTSLVSINFGTGLEMISIEAFSDCQALETVIIPEGVTLIEDRAFMGCMNLKSVSLPASLYDLGESVFIYCGNDLDIAIDADNDNFCSESGLLLSKDKTYLLEQYNQSMIREGVLEIPEGVVTIGTHAFSFCYGITTLKLPSSVEEIGESAFEYCGDLNTIVFSTGLKTIGYAAFAGCNGLTKIAFPEGLEKIGGFAFGSNGGIVPLSFPKSLKCVGAWAFGDADFVMQSPDGMIIVDGCLLKYKGVCPAEVVIPEGVRVIAGDAFLDQTGLTSVTIPATLKGMGDEYNDAFSGCTGLQKVCISDLSAWCGIEFNDSPSPLWYAHHLYLNGQEISDLVIPDGVVEISAMSFEYCSSLSSVRISAGVTNIGMAAFAWCDGLQTVIFMGRPPTGLKISGLLASGRKYYYPPEEFPRQWKQHVGVYGIGAFAGYVPADIPVSVEVLSSEIRASDPRVLDVVYKVTSGRPKVRVRALAFKDGERSFAKVIRPETFIDGTAANIGDEIDANVEHRLSWRVSEDFGMELAKLKFEVLANVGDLLPFTWITIPKSDVYGTMRVSRNEFGETQIFDALMWLYAAKDPSLSLTDGVLMQGATPLVNGTKFMWVNEWGFNADHRQAAVKVVFGSMGFGILGEETVEYSAYGSYVRRDGSVLQYVNDETRLGLEPTGFRQYAYKIVED